MTMTLEQSQALIEANGTITAAYISYMKTLHITKQKLVKAGHSKDMVEIFIEGVIKRARDNYDLFTIYFNKLSDEDDKL